MNEAHEEALAAHLAASHQLGRSILSDHAVQSTFSARRRAEARYAETYQVLVKYGLRPQLPKKRR